MYLKCYVLEHGSKAPALLMGAMTTCYQLVLELVHKLVPKNTPQVLYIICSLSFEIQLHKYMD